VPLTPRRANVFKGAESWIETVEFQRAADGSVTALRVSNANGRLRNVRFDKLD
jgi:hypothetical protein